MTGTISVWGRTRYVASLCVFAPVSLPSVRLYVSGSAYKIVKDRAYHHGTMLISTELDTLGQLLRSGKVRATGCMKYNASLH